MRRRPGAALLLLLAGVAACARAPSTPSAPGTPSGPPAPRGPGLVVVHGGALDPSPRLLAAAERVSAERGVHVSFSSAVPGSGYADVLLVIVGAGSADPMSASVRAQIAADAAALAFPPASHDAYLFMYARAIWHGRPFVGVILASDEWQASAGVRRALRDWPFGVERRYDYLLVAAGLERRGRWDAGRAPVDEVNDFAAAHAWRRDLGTVAGKSVRVLYPPAVPRQAAEAVRRTAEAAAVAAIARLGVAAPEPIDIVLYPDFVTKGKLTGSTRPAEVVELDGGREVRVVAGAADNGANHEQIAHAVTLACVRGLAAMPRRPWLEQGRAAALRQSWEGRSPAAWCAELAAADVLPGLGELLGEGRGEEGSPLLLVPAAALLVEELERRGEMYRLPVANKGALEDAWRVAVQRLPAVPPAAAAPLAAGFQRGVSFAMTNRVETGYASPASRASLENLRGLGVEWVSLMPFAFQDRDTGKLRFMHAGAAGETDEALMQGARDAHALGMRVFWKPHVWLGWDDWSGHFAPDDAAWARWLPQYRRYLAHHAILARLAGAEQLAIGVELGGTTKRGAGWRSLVHTARVLFPGTLTYCANWDEAERVPFWDALDAAGVDAYYPLSSRADASDADLAAGARAVAVRLGALANRLQRPVILTEAGFPSTAAPWIEPHREDTSRDYDPRAQERAYAALAGAIATAPSIRGVYWWKYESDPSIGGPGDRSFVPRGKPAEGIITRLYSAAD